MADQEKNARQVLDRWIERDLTREAEQGLLAPAFEVDLTIDRIAELLAAGKNPILIGESGVGKTAVIYELVRRVARGTGPPMLQGRRIVQVSILRRASALARPDQLKPEVQKFVDALLRERKGMVPFFSDIHFAYNYDLEAHLQSLAQTFSGPILAEGREDLLEAIFEGYPGMEKHYAVLRVEEPDLDRAMRILLAFREQRIADGGPDYTPQALEQALHLTHRFLARNRLPRKALDLLDQAAGSTTAGVQVGETQVVERFCQSHRVPRALIDHEIALDLGALEATFSERLLGQPDAVKAVVNMIGLVKAGLSDLRRPFGVFLFVGPTGVGKTHVAQLLAEYLFGSRERILRFNMADYQAENAGLSLFGDPDAHRREQVRGLLAHRTMGHPFAVLLLDELEKANKKVHDRLMQLIDEGAFINGAGESVSCRSMIVIATSNAGADLYRGYPLGFTPHEDTARLDEEVMRRLEDHFRFEFLNRFDRIVHFRPLSRRHIRTIAQRELAQLCQRAGLKQKKIELEIDEGVLDWLAVNGYDPDYGARFLRRTIERNVTTALADAIVRGNLPSGSRLGLQVRQNRIRAKPLGGSERSALEKEAVKLPAGGSPHVVTLDREGLENAAIELLQAAEKRVADLERKQAERSGLIEQMNAPGFWDQRDARRTVLERFRELDVAVRLEKRLSRPIALLRETRDKDFHRTDDLSVLARRVELAADALQTWEDRIADEGAGEVWMLVSNVDPLRPPKRWVRDLVSMELAWCARLGLSANVVAFERADEQLARAVIDVDGPGAAVNLEMEQGVHRRQQRGQGALRARIDIIPKGDPPSNEWPRIRDVRSRAGPAGMEARCSGRLVLEERGVVLDFLGDHRETLSHLLSDLEQALRLTPSDPMETARIYGTESGGVKDPRTGASISNARSVIKGELDALLKAWRRRQ